MQNEKVQKISLYSVEYSSFWLELTTIISS